MNDALLLLSGAFSGYGGIEMFNRQLVRAFLELGQEEGFGARALILNDGEEDVDDRYVPRGAEPPQGFRGRRATFVAAAMWQALRRKPDLVVFGHIHFARFAPLIRRVSPRSRHWYVAHGIEAWHPLPARIRHGLLDAETILSVSRFTREQLVRNAGVSEQKIQVLSNAIDDIWLRQYAPRPDDPVPPREGGPTLLTVARLAASERYKGVDSVIRALPAVAAKVPGVRYEVVGDGDDRPRLETLAKTLGVADRVHFRGRLWPDELAAAYRDCTVYVMPSSHEGFGIVFLEAALFGKPSVGGRHGGTPEVVEQGVTGSLCDRNAGAEVSGAIITVLSNRTLREELGHAARTRLEERFLFSTFKGSLWEALTASPGSTSGQVKTGARRMYESTMAQSDTARSSDDQSALPRM